jgi:hypothetical protein
MKLESLPEDAVMKRERIVEPDTEQIIKPDAQTQEGKRKMLLYLRPLYVEKHIVGAHIKIY